MFFRLNDRWFAKVSFFLIFLLLLFDGLTPDLSAQSASSLPPSLPGNGSPIGGSFPSIGNNPSPVPTLFSPGDLRVTGGSFGQKEGSPLPTPQSVPTMIYGGIMYQIHILGEVNSPGTYRVSASTRLDEALKMAGGISSQGSERRIQLRRTGGNREIDLPSFKKFGHLDDNPYLLDNDVIFVPLKGIVVQIEGTVKRPGTYELKKERTLEDLIQLAGGFTPGAVNQAPIKVVRFSQEKKEIIDVGNSEQERRVFQVGGGDVIVVPHFLTLNKKFDYNLPSIPGDNPLFYPSFEERIFVLGAVQKPGALPYNPYYNVGQYLTLAGGTTKLAKRSGDLAKISSLGVRTRTKISSEVDPGDTIIVPERYMPPESILSLFLGLSSTALGITTTILSLTR